MLTGLTCSCGTIAGIDDWACPRRDGDDGDHVLSLPVPAWTVDDGSCQPFVRYRRMLRSWAEADDDSWFVDQVERLDAAVADVDGHGFEVTPVARFSIGPCPGNTETSGEPAAELGITVKDDGKNEADNGSRRIIVKDDGKNEADNGSRRIIVKDDGKNEADNGSRRIIVKDDGKNEADNGSRRIIVKDETGNVSGSHKARHTFGLMLHLLVRERRAGRGGRAEGSSNRPGLAIASCGNAAVAAAVVAAAEQWPLTVFVPADAEAATVARLRELDAVVEVCPRNDDREGDPSYHRFRDAVRGGAVPFGCQGPDNGYTIDGGRTLGYELAEQAPDIDRVYVQVGGGALAASVAQGLAAAHVRAALMAVQAEGCAPLARAWERTAELGGLDEARHRRSAVMWPWTPTPFSVAGGILDDETYDWAAVTEAMMATGGRPVVVPESLVIQACDLARSTTGIAVSPTGSAGLAGLLNDNPPRTTTPAVIFTGGGR